MHLDPQPIKVVVYGALGCVVVGYVGLLICFFMGQLKDNGPQAIFALHTVGIFGLLLRYFGGTFKVTATSAQSGA